MAIVTPGAERGAILTNAHAPLPTVRGGIEVPKNTILTTVDSVVNFCRKYSLWPMPFATACCGIELMAVGAGRFDIARFGAEVMRFSPRQCDLLIVAGRVAMKMMPVLQRIWYQMPEPKWCISMGACACTGGIFDTYAVVQGVDRFIPVDCYIPGCPPRPEQILRSLLDMQDKIQKGGTIAGNSGLPELLEREAMMVQKRDLAAGIATAPGTRRRGSIRLPPPRRPRHARRDGHQMSADPDPAPGSATLRLLDGLLGEGGYSTTRFRDNVRVYIPAARMMESLQALKEKAGFNLLSELGGTDYLKYPGRSPEAPRFEVHYVLLNLDTSERLIVKVGVDDPEPTLPSVMPLWRGADWMEREVFDMYGITFDGHPDLRRILMPDEFAAHPLRKDYPLRGRGERHNFPIVTRGQS